MVIAAACLLTTGLLALAVAHGHSPYAFEDRVLESLGTPSVVLAWAHLAELLAAPAVGAALAVSLVLAWFRRAVLRVAVYAALAGAALLISERVVKQLVHRTYYGELTFPSGHVTVVSATAAAMWLALFPLLGTRARYVTFVLGVAWTVLMSLAVVGALWHTPLDAVGSILLSVGIVTAGAAVFEPAGSRRPFMGARRSRIVERRGR